LGLLITPPVYAFLKWGLPQMGFEDIAFLNRMAITFGVDLVVLTAATLLAPLAQPVMLPEQTRIAVQASSGAKFWGAIVVLLTLTLYWIFW
jgi:SSS family solute:Na+ symporter